MNIPTPPARNGQPQPKLTHDPQKQVLCQGCGCPNLRPRIHAFRLPGQIIGSVDITMDQLIVCESCGELVNITTAPLRKDVAKFESKPA